MQNFNNYSNLQTPCYILDENRLMKNFSDLKSAFENAWKNNFIIGYSFKTNSLPYILTWMRSHGSYAEVVSEAEYKLALKTGFSSDKVILNGPVKGENAILEVLEAGGIINLDSFSEIEFLKQNKPKNGKTWKVGLRINFNLEKECPNETMMGLLPGRFGFNVENGSFEKAVNELKNIEYIKIVGLHGHHSTKTKSLKIFKSICKKLGEVSSHLPENCEYVDVGGCIFGDKPGTPTFDEYAKVISDNLSSFEKFNNASLIVEPGASLIASPFSYLCRVVDVKKVFDTTIATTNGSLIHIDPQMHGIPFSKKVIANSNSEKKIESQILAGFTCIEKDRLGEIKNINALKQGDMILFENTGAYSMALSPLFIQYFPAVYVLHDNSFSKVRENWTVDEYIAKNRGL